ncbi:MAG: hypothetical protein KQH53_19370 [Desulfarculaceae bacterium]|nr:hypothetical protein [Desulfarculaceae bacterium]
MDILSVKLKILAMLATRESFAVVGSEEISNELGIDIQTVNDASFLLFNEGSVELDADGGVSLLPNGRLALSQAKKEPQRQQRNKYSINVQQAQNLAIGDNANQTNLNVSVGDLFQIVARTIEGNHAIPEEDKSKLLNKIKSVMNSPWTQNILGSAVGALINKI